jgi:hypothetical protein
MCIKHKIIEQNFSKNHETGLRRFNRQKQTNKQTGKIKLIQLRDGETIFLEEKKNRQKEKGKHFMDFMDPFKIRKLWWHSQTASFFHQMTWCFILLNLMANFEF